MEITPELTRLWKESLEDLTPSQIREGFISYLKCERASFRPTPGDIIGNAPADAADKPRLKTDPKCKECGGSGWKPTETAKGNAAVTECDCRVIEYDGKLFLPEPKQLPAAEDGELLRRLTAKIPEVVGVGKSIPPPRDLNLNPDEKKLERQRIEAQLIADRFAGADRRAKQ